MTTYAERLEALAHLIAAGAHAEAIAMLRGMRFGLRRLERLGQ